MCVANLNLTFTAYFISSNPNLGFTAEIPISFDNEYWKVWSWNQSDTDTVPNVTIQLFNGLFCTAWADFDMRVTDK